MKIPVYSQSGEKTQEEVELNPKIFEVAAKPALVHQVATSMLSNLRNAVAHTKTRGDVRGGGRKPWKQKGTGRARHGSIRSPLWKGGGVTFGPRSNRNWTKKINKNMGRQAIFAVLSDRAKANLIVVLDKLELPEAKTKVLINSLKWIESKKYSIVTADKMLSLKKAARNVKNLKVFEGNNLNVLDLLNTDKLIILKNALELIEQTYLKK